MTGKEKFIKALKREPLSGHHVPTFELVFFLTMELLGKVHPSHRSYYQWNQMSLAEKKCQMNDMADCYIEVAKKYNHSAIFIHPNPGHLEGVVELIQTIRDKTGDEYFIMMHGDPTFAMPDGDNMIEFSARMYECPDQLNDESKRNTENSLEFALKLKQHDATLDGFALCSDYCFNVNPFFTPDMFDELIVPYLSQVLKGYREMGYYSIKHTDGNINPIVEQIVNCRPDAIHSLDPQGGVSLKDIKSRFGDKVCLIGNVNCGLLQTGTDEECAADVRRCLSEGMHGGGGFIFSTSNCVYTGMPLNRYDMMNKIWFEEGIYR